MKKIVGIFLALTLAFSFSLVTAVPVAADDPTTIGSSTMVFEGALTDDGDGSYSGTIPMIAPGFDVYARNGAMALFVDDRGDVVGPSDVIAGHDAYPGWPLDVPDWDCYALTLNDSWKLVYNEDSSWETTGCVPMSGAMDWDNMYAAETDIGYCFGDCGDIAAADPGWAAANGGGPACWDMDWIWGSEVVPLAFPGFHVAVQDLGGGNYRVLMAPADGRPTVDPPGPVVNEDTGESYGTLQAAIDGSSAGDTIYVAVGTYNEGQIIINHNLSIVGGSGSKPVIQPTADFTGLNAGDAWYLVNSGVSFSLSNVELNGNGHFVWQAIRNHGDTTIDNVDFRTIWGSASGSPYMGLAVLSFGGTVPGGGGSDSHGGGGAAATLVVDECTFEQIGRVGVVVKGTESTADIIECDYTGKGVGDWLDYAFEAGAGGEVAIEDCTATDCRGVASSDGSTSAGILVTTYYGPGTEATITGSTFTDNTGGIAVGYDGSDTSIVVAHFNNIYGNDDYGVDSTAPAVDAEHNWWGDSSGPSHDSPVDYGDRVSDNIDYQPWLIDQYTGQVPAKYLRTASNTILPEGGVGLAYSRQLLAVGGDHNYSWSMYYGILPPGLALSPTGLISGTPTSPGPFDFEVQLHDGTQGIWKAYHVDIDAITVTSPNGGETWDVGSTQTINWTSVGVTGNVNIYLSLNGGATWRCIVVNTPNDGSQDWVVTGYRLATTQARIKVRSLHAPTVFDISDADFTIAQSITVTSPNGGETWDVGSTQTINWTSVGIDGNVNIYLSRNGGASWSIIKVLEPNDGSYDWVVTGPATTQARIKVSSYPILDTSDADFNIE